MGDHHPGMVFVTGARVCGARGIGNGVSVFVLMGDRVVFGRAEPSRDTGRLSGGRDAGIGATRESPDHSKGPEGLGLYLLAQGFLQSNGKSRAKRYNEEQFRTIWP